MKAAVITVGDELTSGDKLDTNFPRVARRLADLGVEVGLHESVPDDEIAIARALKATQAVAGVVVVTGGLGPTSDDVTRQGIARALGRRLEFNDAVAARLSARFPEADPEFLDLILKQAYAVEEAEIIMPRGGTAPGLILFDGDQVIYVLPGVPAELEEMLESKVAPDLSERIGDREPLSRVTLRTAGLPEAEVQTIIADLEPAYGAVRFGLLAHPGLVDVVLTARESQREDVDAALDEIRERLGEAVYGADEETLPEVVGRLLREHGLTVATAESCTGGLLAKMITDAAGSSEYFVGGMVAYADSAKTACLDVNKATLEEHGAVSEPTAREMASGLRGKLGSDIGVAITGVAGPGGGSERNPVGTVYVCVMFESGELTVKLKQPGSRDQIRSRAANVALNQVRLHLARDAEGEITPSTERPV